MNSRTRTILWILSAACILLTSPAHAAKTAAEKGSVEALDSKFRLKPGARVKICLTCHPGFEEKLKKTSVHTPLRKTGCTACHSPHTSNFPKQLSADVSALCLTCHAGMRPAGARSTHQPVLEGKCVLCHDPHSSNNKFNLLKSGNDLCYGCHKDQADTIPKAKFRHAPVERGCINCHSPHASAQAAFLLKSEPPTLCKGCHQTDKPLFAKQHMNYPVANSTCTSCHNPHGSNRAGLLYNTVHPPFANKMCNQCHEGAGTPNPLALKKRGFELCRGCHSTLVNEALSKNRLHWPVAGKDGCLNCHSPHASSQKGLLKGPMIQVCGKCHADTIQRQAKSDTKHQPIQDGLCTACHSPHASDNALLFNQASTIELCGQCHDWQKHSTHPIGEKIKDKRNKNLTMQCLSCHRAHGTEYKHMLPAATITELCTQCHVEYKR